MNDVAEMTQIRLSVNQTVDEEVPDYVFEGVMVAHVTSRKTSSTFWTEISAYKTSGGQIVVHTKGCADGPGYQTWHKVLVFKSAEQMMREMGVTGLHRRLWRRMGITEFVIA